MSRPTSAADHDHQPGGARQGRARSGPGDAPAGRIHAYPGQGDQRGRHHQIAPDQQSAVGAGHGRRGRPEYDQAGPKALEAWGSPRRCARAVPPGGDGDGPTDDRQPQRASGRICGRPALQQRVGPARSGNWLRRWPGDPGPRLPGRGPHPVHRPSGYRGETPASTITTARRLSHTSPSSTPRAGSTHRSRSGRPPTSSSSGRSTAPMVASCCCRRAGSP